MVPPVVGRTMGDTRVMLGGAYARPTAAMDAIWPSTLTVMSEMAPEAAGSKHRSDTSTTARVQFEATRSPAGTLMVTDV